MGYAESENFKRAREAWEREGTPMPYRLVDLHGDLRADDPLLQMNWAGGVVSDRFGKKPFDEVEPTDDTRLIKIVLLVIAAWALGALMAWLLAPVVLMCGDVPVWKF